MPPALTSLPPDGPTVDLLSSGTTPKPGERARGAAATASGPSPAAPVTAASWITALHPLDRSPAADGGAS